MEIKGKIVRVLPLIQGVSARGPWSKATVVIEYQSGNYTKTLALDNISKAEEFSKLAVGSELTFLFDVSSNEYNGRFYTQCNCFGWKQADSQPQEQPQSQGSSPVGTDAESSADDMPF